MPGVTGGVTCSVSPSRKSPIFGQLLLVTGALAGLAATPPATGRMLLLPLDAAAERGMIALAIDRGARLVGPGPVAGSFVVEGERAALFPALARRRVALVAAPPTGCAP